MNLLAALLLLLQATQSPLPEVVRRSRLDRSRGVDFHALVSPESVYVGQQATYELGVFIDAATRQRLRRNPEFLPPESRAMLAYDLPDKAGGFAATIDGRTMEVHVFRRALFPLTPGRYAVPPARLNYALPQSASFFSREESFTLRSEAVSVTAVALPSAGRPADWLGAVGSWRASARIDTTARRPGAPFVLTLRIEGQGNVTLLPRPAIAVSWANVVAADERLRLDSGATLLRGAKEFDWLVTPRAGGRQVVPALRYPYFNPYSRRWEIAQSAPIAVRTIATTLDSAAAPDVPEAKAPSVALALRPSLGAQTSEPLGDSWFVRMLLLLAPLPAAAAWWVRRPRRPRREPTTRERLDRFAGNADAAAPDVRRALLDALAQRLHVDPAALARPGAWEHALRREGVTAGTAAAVCALLDALDAAAFDGEATRASGAAGARARDLFALVDREARRDKHGVRAAAFLLALAAFPSAIAGVDDGRAMQAFAQGVAAYAGGDAVLAAHRFADAARLAPRASNAWANFGTASWAASDTAGAVTGWQRALRLDPLAVDVRERLSLVRAPQDAGVAKVPSLPPRPLAALAVLLWLGGWTISARQAWRRRSIWRIVALTTLGGGGLLAGVRRVELALAGRGLVVVAENVPVRTLPALGADPGATPLVGEVGRVERHQGVWVYVRLDASRAGWLPAASVVPLGRD